MTSTIIVAICAIVLFLITLIIFCTTGYGSPEEVKKAKCGILLLIVGIAFAAIAMCDLIFNEAKRVKTKKHPVIYREIVITERGGLVQMDTTYTYIFNRK